MEHSLGQNARLMTFEEAIACVTSLQGRGWRLGLDRMEEFLHRAGLDDALGRGPTSPRFIHVAGTNGKGSVTAFAQSLLVELGYRTGATYSPYVYDVLERIQFGRESVSPDEFALLVKTLWPIASDMEGTALGGPTEFEFKTAMGFLHWKRMRCEWVALEVGLGGRLDATNVVEPACSVVTTIDWDHAEILGDTLGKIAAEKAGIIKPGRPVVVGKMAEEPREVILEIAAERGAPAIVWGRDVFAETQEGRVRVVGPGYSHDGLQPGIAGVVQPHNLALAIAALHAAGAVRDASEEVIRRGAAAASIPGRMESRRAAGRDWILDGAHNAQAARSVVQSLVQGRMPRTMIAGMLSGHDARTFFREFTESVASVHLAPIDFHRSRDPFELGCEIGDLFPRVEPHASVEEALDAAIAEGVEPILVTGSFYLVGEVGRLLERCPEGGARALVP